MSDSPFKYQSECDKVVDGRCKYCGSMSPREAIRLMRTPGTEFSGADFKYGWPHKFYFGTLKFYNNHLEELTADEFREFAELSKAVFGVVWSKTDEGKIGWKC